MQKRLLSISILSIILTACGGGGSFNAETRVPNDKKSDDGIVAIQDKANIKKVDTDNHDHTHSDGSTTGGNNGSTTGSNNGSTTGGNNGSTTGGNNGSTTGGNNGSTTGGNNNANVAFKVATSEEINAHNQLMQPSETEGSDIEYGFSLATPITGYPLSNRKVYNVAAPIDESKAQKDNDKNHYDVLTFINNPSKVSKDNEPEKIEVDITKETWEAKPGVVNYADYIVEKLPDQLDKKIKNYFHIDEKEGLKLVEFNNTKIGALLKPAGDGYYANLFYKGKEPSKAIPTSGSATYHGVWDVAQALTNDTGIEFPSNELINSYNQVSMSPLELTADFGQKTLKGKLKANQTSYKTFAYDVDATINENTFSGTAVSEEGRDSATISDTAQVTGGFFGEQASELAGKLISEKAFGVFAAKQTSNDNLVIPEPKKLTQAKATVLNTRVNIADGLATDFDDIFKATEKLDNLDSITINGVPIDLNGPNQSNIFANEPNLPLQFTRMGAVSTNQDENQFAFFYQGQLTQDMPVEGSAKYQGNWVAYGQPSDGSSSYLNTKRYGTKFDFTANFADKSLSGSFKTPSGNDGMTLDGVTITGNTFKGMANIVGSGLSHDDGIGGRPIKGSVNVSGAFFGPKANELGGGFHKEDHSFAGVFAGKQVK